jgi:hypothetical protein
VVDQISSETMTHVVIHEACAECGEMVASASGGWVSIEDYRAERAEVERLKAMLNTPQTHNFIDALRIEMPHQRERWGAEHDSGKTPADWFWLVGYLAGKALHSLMTGNSEKAKHHVITSAAALGNWFLAITGENTSMRPGIDIPKGEQHG